MGPLLATLLQGAPGTQIIKCAPFFVHTWASCTNLSKCFNDKIGLLDNIHSLSSCRILRELFKGSSPADRDLPCWEYLIHWAGSEGKVLLLSRLDYSVTTLVLTHLNDVKLRCLWSLQYVKTKQSSDTYWSTAPSLTQMYIYSSTWSAILLIYFAGCQYHLWVQASKRCQHDLRALEFFHNVVEERRGDRRRSTNGTQWQNIYCFRSVEFNAQLSVCMYVCMYVCECLARVGTEGRAQLHGRQTLRLQTAPWWECILEYQRSRYHIRMTLYLLVACCTEADCLSVQSRLTCWEDMGRIDQNCTVRLWHMMSK